MRHILFIVVLLLGFGLPIGIGWGASYRAQQKADKKDLAINLLKAQNDYQAAVIDELQEQLKACKPEEKK